VFDSTRVNNARQGANHVITVQQSVRNYDSVEVDNARQGANHVITVQQSVRNYDSVEVDNARQGANHVITVQQSVRNYDSAEVDNTPLTLRLTQIPFVRENVNPHKSVNSNMVAVELSDEACPKPRYLASKQRDS
jgi:hypothetical protein